jgi:hypothetical protein
MRKSVELGSDRWMGLYGAIGFPRDVSRNLIKTLRPRRVTRHRTEWNLSCFLLIDPLIESQFPYISLQYQNISYTVQYTPYTISHFQHVQRLEIKI